MGILKRGLVQIYTGNGKGKTTAALGLAWRMLGAGGSVYFCQFLKPEDFLTSEAVMAGAFSERLEFDRIDYDWDMQRSWIDQEHLAAMKRLIGEKLLQIREIAEKGDYDLMVLDEFIFCLSKEMAGLSEVLNIIDSRAEHVEVVLTGRGPCREMEAAADLVTEMKEVKHPYQQQILARRGIEF